MTESFVKSLMVTVLLWAPAIVMAEGIVVDNASGGLKDGFYQVNANFSYELSESVIEALNHGIQLRFDITVEVKRVRAWRWDQTVATAILSYTLDYLPLGNNYQVTNSITSEKNRFNDLDDALEYLGRINDFPVIAEQELDSGQSYNCFLMSELRVRNLPLPLQPLAVVSPSWELSSPWYEWPIE